VATPLTAMTTTGYGLSYRQGRNMPTILAAWRAGAL